MKISKLNEVYLTLEVDDSLEKELSDYFTFEVPGAKFMPHYRKKLWDGKIRLFSPHIPPQKENQLKCGIISWTRYTMQYPQIEHFYYLLPLLVSH